MSRRIGENGDSVWTLDLQNGETIFVTAAIGDPPSVRGRWRAAAGGRACPPEAAPRGICWRLGSAARATAGAASLFGLHQALDEPALHQQHHQRDLVRLCSARDFLGGHPRTEGQAVHALGEQQELEDREAELVGVVRGRGEQDLPRVARRTDEARHVAFGLAHLRTHLDADPLLRPRLVDAVERRHDALAQTSGLNDEAFATLAVLAAGAFAEADRSAEAGPPALGFSPRAWKEERLIERRFSGFLDPERISRTHAVLTAEPHRAGTPGSRRVAEFILAEARKAGFKAEIVQYQFYNSHPGPRRIEWIARSRRWARRNRRRETGRGQHRFFIDS